MGPVTSYLGKRSASAFFSPKTSSPSKVRKTTEKIVSTIFSNTIKLVEERIGELRSQSADPSHLQRLLVLLEVRRNNHTQAERCIEEISDPEEQAWAWVSLPPTPSHLKKAKKAIMEAENHDSSRAFLYLEVARNEIGICPEGVVQETLTKAKNCDSKRHSPFSRVNAFINRANLEFEKTLGNPQNTLRNAKQLIKEIKGDKLKALSLLRIAQQEFQYGDEVAAKITLANAEEMAIGEDNPLSSAKLLLEVAHLKFLHGLPFDRPLDFAEKSIRILKDDSDWFKKKGTICKILCLKMALLRSPQEKEQILDAFLHEFSEIPSHELVLLKSRYGLSLAKEKIGAIREAKEALISRGSIEKNSKLFKQFMLLLDAEIAA